MHFAGIFPLKSGASWKSSAKKGISLALLLCMATRFFIEDNIFTFISRLIVQVDDGNFIFSVVNYFHQNLYTKMV